VTAAAALRSFGLAILSGFLVLRLFQFRRIWPWRVLELERSPSAPRRSAPRRSARRPSAPIQPADPERDLPVAIDLLRVAVSAGHTVHSAVTAVAKGHDGPVADALGGAVRRHEHGTSLIAELERLPDEVGSWIHPLSTTLVLAARSGSPLVPALERLAELERRRLRRKAEERIRRLPVTLLAPLVGLILPAFIVLTVVPVGITTARAALDAAPGEPPSPVVDVRWSPP
jgi:type II secretory pathway component PulF